MRILIAALFLLIFAVFSIIALPLLWLLGKANSRRQEKISQKIVKNTFAVILFISGVKKKIIGLERIPRDRAVLFAINHRGFFDVIISLYSVPVLSGFVAKKEIKKVPFLKTWMDYIKCVFLDRENAREGIKAILKGIDNIKNGTSMFISPEGTRNKGEGLLSFKPGSLKIAEKTGCPIVPVAITGSDDVLEKHIPWLKSAKMTIEYGEPILVGEMSKEVKGELMDHVRNEVLKMYEKNTKLDW